ncbi:MAG: DUF21 domain-containing protein [Geminicoccaceae bacterium]|nr:DUF21 domain-containing protein [Geminicoccaceae bacterium]MCB9945651.1 DUF21 domain-containing protein [Geminicoccaceae bacterium]
MLLVTAAAIPILILCSAMTSASETAVTALSEARIRQMAREGNRRAVILASLLDDKERLIGVLLIANNIFNILSASLATNVFLHLTGEVGVAIATVIMTVLVVVFAEVLPKTYAIRDSEKFALTMAPSLRALVILLEPPSAVLKRIVRAILRLFGDRESSFGGHQAMDELRARIAELRGYSSRFRQRSQMLRGVMDLERMTIGEIMTHRSMMTTFDGDRLVGEAKSEINDSRFSRFPLWQGDRDRITGLLHVRDLLAADPASRLADHMREVTFVPETARLESQLAAFQASHSHLAMVVDEHGTLKGLVTLEDVMEEIVGEILDERDMPTPLPEPDAGGALTVEGRVAPRDINRHMDWDLPEDEPTMAALLTDRIGRIPGTGHRTELGRHTVTVLERRGHRLTRLRIDPPQPGEDGGLRL